MFNLFNKNKVRAGKQNNEEKKPVAAVGQAGQNEKQTPLAALSKTWAKLNKMDRKQAYTYGGIAIVVLVALIMLGTAVSSGEEEAFADFQTRGYDLANMPFSSDEAEQYLLAAKYPDMQQNPKNALYSKESKEARQAQDAKDAAATLDVDAASSTASEYVPGRYYGGGASGRTVTPTQVNSLNSASLKGGSGSGMSGTFGPSGDFSNFKSQEKGSDRFVPQGPGSGDARRALFQAATGSRAAAGLKDNKLVNAKKALMGGNIKGSDAFMSDSGAVDLSKAAGLNLDTNAPISSADPKDFDKALDQAKGQSESDAQEEDENRWWQEKLIDFAKMVAERLISWGLSEAENAVNVARQQRAAEQMAWNDYVSEVQEEVHIPQYGSDTDIAADNLFTDSNLREATGLKLEGDVVVNEKTGAIVATRTTTTDPNTGETLTTTSYTQGQDPVQLSSKQTDKVNRANANSVIQADPKRAAEWNRRKTEARSMSVISGGRRTTSTSSDNDTFWGEDSKGEYVVRNGRKQYLQEAEE